MANSVNIEKPWVTKNAKEFDKLNFKEWIE